MPLSLSVCPLSWGHWGSTQSVNMTGRMGVAWLMSLGMWQEEQFLDVLGPPWAALGPWRLAQVAGSSPKVVPEEW